MVFRRATFEPLARTLARETLPKLPSPISLITSNRSSKAAMAYEVGLLPCSVTAIWLAVRVQSERKTVVSI
jgi:hypothetical protein